MIALNWICRWGGGILRREQQRRTGLVESCGIPGLRIETWGTREFAA